MTKTYRAAEVTRMVLLRLVIVYLVLISVISVKGECLGLGLWCLTPLSKIFQLYRGGLKGEWDFHFVLIL